MADKLPQLDRPLAFRGGADAWDAGLAGELVASEYFEAASGSGTGTLSAVEVGADGLASTGDVFVSGALAVTESGADVFASGGDVFAIGNMAAVESGEDTLASLGDVLVTGSVAANEAGGDTFSASGADEPQAQGAVGGGGLTFEQAQAIYEAQTQRKRLPELEPKPAPQKQRKAAVAPASAQDSAPAFTTAPLVLPTLAPLPDFASVQARIAEAQAAQAAIGLAQLQAAQDAEAEAVAMLMMMLEAA